MSNVLTIVLVAGLSMLPLSPSRAEEKSATIENKAEGDKADLKQILERKMSCEFVDTPLNEVFKFFGATSKVNLIIAPPVRENNVVINLKVSDMPISDALNYVCKMAHLSLEVSDTGVFISDAGDGAEKKKPDPLPATAKLRIKLGNGNEIEADGAIFNNNPELLEKLVDRFLKEDEKAEKK